MSVAPFSIEETRGQEVALSYLSYFAKFPDKLPGVLIFHGPDGVGKWHAAERFARHLLCLRGTSCGDCESCRLFMRGLHPDYIQFPRNKNIAIGKEKDPDEFTVRWLLYHKIPFKPHTSHKRIVLFPESQRINHEAETTLLKTLEEPPSHTLFILLVNDLNLLKKTIVSRSLAIPFHYLNQSAIREIRSHVSFEGRKFFGGSLNPFEFDQDIIDEWLGTIREHAFDSLLLLKLENWVRERMADKKSFKEVLSTIDFLDLFSLLLLYVYREKDFDLYAKHIQAILEFKSKLHSQIPAIEYFLISKLFSQLASYTH
ncbi:DNA polymerase III subunit gamma and tau [Leptospira ryugenii]|uniref:DNA polymerase III subunit gamma and tau n=1 Tax=Leptospira ryugenii TaxID=1917863 RepID=A0A2P2E348_9LEPT|nr:hypothetical protein [Leptospira ryugenii]GBF51335.1 DNA polymerase III subunit gamma and tau [Leptospira ryugenii]